MTLSNGQGLQPAQAALRGVGLRPAARPGARSALRWTEAGYAAFLIAVVLALYLPAIGFGLMWDDPRWYQQGAGLPAWQLFLALPTFQFYRPLTLLLTRLFVAPDGVVNVPLAHLIILGAHLGTTLLSVRVLRTLGFSTAHARLTALLAAGLPFAYQAVAWQQAQQPLVMFPVVLALWLAGRSGGRRRGLFVSGSALVYAAALLVHESALLFVFAFFWLAAVQKPGLPGRAGRWWPVLHLTLALAYGLIWINLPRQAGITGTGFQMPVLAYLFQAVVFPLAAVGARWIPSLAQWPVSALLALYAVLAGLLALAALRWAPLRAMSLCLAWIAAGLLPVWAGLAWDYVQIGERLLYPAALGIAGLWAAPILWLVAPARETPRWRRMAGGLALLLYTGVCLWQVQQFQRLYRLGTSHLVGAAQVLSAAPDSRVLFVNFPDRLEFRARPYPLGFWGLVLAPVVQDLADFAVAATGHSAADRSLAVFEAGVDGREQGPYRVALRGEGAAPDDVWSAALWADTVYLTDYDPSGRLTLRPVGAVRPAPAGVNPLARLSGGTDLLEAELVDVPGQPPRLRLLWHSRLPQTLDTTIFVHLWRAGVFEAGADGDSLGGLLPASAWQPEGAVLDLRALPDLSAAPGEYEVRVGLYRRWDGVRLPAYAPDGQRLPADSVPVATLRVP